MKKTLLCLSAMILLCGQLLQAQSKVALIDDSKESIVRIFAFTMPFYLDETTFRSGTGYVVGDGGLIMTSYQVVKDINGLLIYSENDNKPYYGTVVWFDSLTDAAIIKAVDCTLKPLEFADPESVYLGDETLIFGHSGDPLAAESLKITWGLISGNSKDSTIQTTATVNQASLGGPAINMKGKVIGTVHSKTAGVGLDLPSEIKNVRFAKHALDLAKNDNGATKNFYGAATFDAYKKICDGAVQGWKSANMEDVAAKEALDKTVKDLISEALNLDAYYIEAYYFRSAYYLFQSRYCCLKNMDEDAKAMFLTFKQNFQEADNKATIFKASLLSAKSSLNGLRKEASMKELNCKDYNVLYKKYIEVSHNQVNRSLEFNNYLVTGQPPLLLKQAVGGRSTTDGSGSTFGGDGSSIFFMASIAKARPVRLSVVLPFGFQDFNKNLGISIGNAGSSKYYSVIFCKYQFGFNLIQSLDPGDNGDVKYAYKRYLLPSFDIGISGNILKMARFNPKPFVTVGYNPAFYSEKYDSLNTTTTVSKMYLANGSFNFGIDLDLWVTSSFGMSLSYQYTWPFASLFPSLFNDTRLQQLMYSMFKIGIIF